MTFNTPGWFLLIPFFLLLMWWKKEWQLWSPIRFLILLLITLILCQPSWDQKARGLNLWVFWDRSASTEDLVDKDIQEWKKLLQNSKPSRKDQLHFLNYASDLSPEGPGELSTYHGNRDLSRTRLAIENALAMRNPKEAYRFLIFSDGYSTEPLQGLPRKLEELQIPLDYRILKKSLNEDYQLSRFQVPSQVQFGEPFLLKITIRGHEDGMVPLLIYRGDQLILKTEAELKNGLCQVDYADRLSQAGSHEYRAEIAPTLDAHPGNNSIKQWVEVSSGPRLLLLTKYLKDPLAQNLLAQGFSVETILDHQKLHPGMLSGAKAVILNNVPAYEIPRDFLEAIPFYVEQQGGGLLITGGKQSYGAGGYFESAIDPLLPISMELKNEHRKLALTMAIVLDRSGSMAASVSGGTKMDLANNGSARAIELLGQLDEICLFAVDSEPHSIIKKTLISNKKKALIKKALSVQSAGGGIYVYNGLKAGWEAIRDSKNGTKHIILFSDAADSEQPGRYKELLKKITDNNGTVSVIGLGTEQDADADFLKDIAKLGKGRIFFTENAVELPQLFAQETVAVARSAFIQEPVETQATGDWNEISQTELEWLPLVDSYNISYAREEAAISLIAKDEYLSPLIANVQRGLGRVSAVSFPLGGELSSRIRGWESYQDFCQTLGRWVMGDELPSGIGIQSHLEGTRLSLRLLYDSERWNQKLSRTPPQLILTSKMTEQKLQKIPWERVQPGEFQASRDLDPGDVVRGVVQVGSHALPFGPLTVGTSAEWAFDQERLQELKDLSVKSGGKEIFDLSEAWVRPLQKHTFSLQIPLLIAILVLMILDALISRTGWQFPELTWSKGLFSIPQNKKATREKQLQEKASSEQISEAAPAVTVQSPSSKATPSPPSPPKQTPTQESRQQRYQRAKRRR